MDNQQFSSWLYPYAKKSPVAGFNLIWYSNVAHLFFHRYHVQSIQTTYFPRMFQIHVMITCCANFTGKLT
jgi:hypothetical protein